MTIGEMRIYLGGPIADCTDAECRDWREAVKKRLRGKFEFGDPMDRDYRGYDCDEELSRRIVSEDESDYGSCKIGLFYCPKPSVGTSMEIRDMHKWLKKTVIIVCPQEFPSPWLVANCTVMFKTFDEAFNYLDQVSEIFHPRKF